METGIDVSIYGAKMKPSTLLVSTMALSSLTLLPAAACTLSVAGLDFGSIDPLSGTSTMSQATVTIDCPLGTSFSVSVSAGGGTFAERLMSYGSFTLGYNLYLDESHSTIWGDGNSGTGVWTSTGLAGAQSQQGYGVVPSQSGVRSGSYSDSLTVIATF